MADKVFNIAKGQLGYYASLPGTSDALIAVPLEAAGLVDDATMEDYATLADLLAGASNEQTTIGRKTLTSVSVTVDVANDCVTIDCDDFSWLSPSGNALGAVVICYDPNTGTSTDATRIPLTKHDLVVTTASDIVVEVATTGLARAS